MECCPELVDYDPDYDLDYDPTPWEAPVDDESARSRQIQEYKEKYR